MSNTELIESLDSSEYDTEAMRMDERNHNFSPERVEEYRHENIVAESLSNGQFTQAKRQCAAFGLEYRDELAKFNQTPK